MWRRRKPGQPERATGGTPGLGAPAGPESGLGAAGDPGAPLPAEARHRNPALAPDGAPDPARDATLPPASEAPGL